MELDLILHTLDTAGQIGVHLRTEETLVLYNSLLILQNENHFRKVYFWGKIFGAEKDYYVAFGYKTNILLNRTYYYSLNGQDWGLLPLPTEHGKKLTSLCTTLFQGDPALVIDILLDKDEFLTGEVFKSPQVRQLKEEDRLAATVYFINQEACIVPRGALFKRPDGTTVENLSFEGVNELNARELKTYLHFRLPENKWNTNLLTRTDYNYAMDFLDTIDSDIPEGCWSIQIEMGGLYAVVQSLYWKGFVLFHRIDMPVYGFCYFGLGKKNVDLPFMFSSFQS